MKSPISFWFYRSLMQLHRSRHSSRNAGYMLFLVVSLSVTLLGLLMAYALLAKVHRITIKSSASSSSGLYGAEAAANLRGEQLRQIYQSYGTPTGLSPTTLSACLDDDNTNNGSGDLGCQIISFEQTNQSLAGIQAASFVVTKNDGQAVEGAVPSGEAFQGLNMLEYSYVVNVASKKQGGPADQVTTMNELGIKARLIPMFQFAAFYLNDLEILPGQPMTLGGPVHTNGSLYLGSNSTSNPFRISSQITLVGSIYNARKNNNDTYPNGAVQIANGAGTFLNLLQYGTGSTTQTRTAMSETLLASHWGTQIKTGVEALSIPSASVLSASGDFAQKADLQIVYTPAATSTAANTASPPPTTVPFQITSVNRAGTTPVSTVLTEGELRSLRQPVLLPTTLSGTNIADTNYRFCDVPTAVSPGVTLSSAQRTAIANALYVAIVSQATPLAFNSSHPAFSAINETMTTATQTTFNTLLDNAGLGLSSSNLSTLKTNLGNSTPAAIAALDSRCFIPAPLQDIGKNATSHNSPYRFYNDREGREMRLLQINLRSLTAWNGHGRYVVFNSGTVSDNNSGQGYNAAQRLFATTTADASAPLGSFQNLGLAASDTSEGGLVFHATINGSTYPSANGSTSPYGFALVQGQQLPGLSITNNNSDPTGLTFVSDQAVYVQGDYNGINGAYNTGEYDPATAIWSCPSNSTSYNCRNWQPASILADSLNILSNACLNTDRAIDKDTAKNCNTGSGRGKVSATATTVNAALLSGTDITTSGNYNGGLENYPRFSEQWTNVYFTYRGSFVSISTPVHVSGSWSNQLYDPPSRSWTYDTRFNTAAQLPPLTPRFLALRQESFSRQFDQ